MLSSFVEYKIRGHAHLACWLLLFSIVAALQASGEQLFPGLLRAEWAGISCNSSGRGVFVSLDRESSLSGPWAVISGMCQVSSAVFLQIWEDILVMCTQWLSLETWSQFPQLSETVKRKIYLLYLLLRSCFRTEIFSTLKFSYISGSFGKHISSKGWIFGWYAL